MARGHWKASKNGSDEEFNAERKRAIEAVENNRGEGGSISVKARRQVTFSSAEETERSKNLILESKKDIEDKKKLEDLYNEVTAVIIDFYSRLLEWLETLQLKLRLLDCIDSADGAQRMENIKKFNKELDLLNQRLPDLFSPVKTKYEEIMKDMKKKLRKSNKKLMLLRVCGKICGFIFAAALIWAAVAAAIPAPPALVVALAAPLLPIASLLGEFIRPWSKEYEKKAKVEGKILEETQKRIDGGLYELKRINDGVARLVKSIRGIHPPTVHFFSKDQIETVNRVEEDVKRWQEKLRDEIHVYNGVLKAIKEERSTLLSEITSLKARVKENEGKQQLLKDKIVASKAKVDKLMKEEKNCLTAQQNLQAGQSPDRIKSRGAAVKHEKKRQENLWRQITDNEDVLAKIKQHLQIKEQMIKTNNAEMEDAQWQQLNLEREVNDSKGMLEDIKNTTDGIHDKRQTRSFVHHFSTKKVEVEDLKKRHESLKIDITSLCVHLKTRINEIRMNQNKDIFRKT